LEEAAPVFEEGAKVHSMATGAEGVLLRKEKESGRGILLTEHNPTILLPLMDRQLKLDGGHFIG